MAKMRVHELAKELNIDSKELVEKLKDLGYEVKSHSSTLEDDQVTSAKERLAKKAAKPAKPMGAGVVIRRSKARGETLGVGAALDEEPPAEEAEPTPEVEAEPAPVVAAESPSEASPSTPAEPEAPTSAEPTAPSEPAPVAAAATPRPTANQAVVVGRVTLPPGSGRPPQRRVVTPGVRGTAAHTRTAPPTPSPEVAAEKATPVVPGENRELRENEEIKLINGVPHIVQKTAPGRPTANQAVLVSRPVYIQKQFAPNRSRENIPMAPGITPNSLVRNVREFQVVNEGGRAREVFDVKKGRKPSGVRNEKATAYSKQDLLDLVRSRSYIPIIGRKKRPTKKGKKTEITEMKQSKKVIEIEDAITVRELSERMGVKGTEIVRKWLQQGRFINLNQAVDLDTATLIAAEYDWEVRPRSYEVADLMPAFEEKPDQVKARPPVVTVMGHVDHGKTSLLDALRQARVAAGEAGGITQHIGAYSVTLPGKGDVTFFDTPGHEAFSAIRSRGAQSTDIVILVVAADDGVQPQTIESIKHAKAADVPIVVAINKIDKPGVNTDAIKTALANHGLQPEEWGGDTPMVPISAKERTNLDLLLENVLLQAELLELQANVKKPASGVVVESSVARGRGAVATVLVQEGTLEQGQVVVVGQHWGRVRAMTDERGQALKKVLPGYPVQIVGLNGTPAAGEEFNVVLDDKMATAIVDNRIKRARAAEEATSARTTVEDLLKKTASDAPKELVVIVKADVAGSTEAVTESLKKLSGKKVVVNVIQKGVGNINESDVNLANAGKAVIFGFNVKPDNNAAANAARNNVQIKSYSIIYDLLDDARRQMEDLLEPTYKENVIGKAEVRMVFSVSKVGQIAGCLVMEGRVTRSASGRVLRNGKVIHSGKLSSLKHFKDDVKEVISGTECGIGLEGFDGVEVGDVLEIFETQTIRQTLD